MNLVAIRICIQFGRETRTNLLICFIQSPFYDILNSHSNSNSIQLNETSKVAFACCCCSVVAVQKYTKCTSFQEQKVELTIRIELNWIHSFVGSWCKFNYSHQKSLLFSGCPSCVFIPVKRRLSGAATGRSRARPPIRSAGRSVRGHSLEFGRLHSRRRSELWGKGRQIHEPPP